jgi:hypothetical protein
MKGDGVENVEEGVEDVEEGVENVEEGVEDIVEERDKDEDANGGVEEYKLLLFTGE